MRRTFRHGDRLHGDRAFTAVFDAKLRKSRGPLTVFMKPTDLPRHRLGLSIGRRVGPAVRRNRLKRHLREAFRLSRSAFPCHPQGCYDIVISARAHEPLRLAAYQALLTELVAEAARVHHKRLHRAENKAGTASEGTADGNAS